MEHESLVLDLEELARRMREDPIFPWRSGDAELVARVNEASSKLGLAAPVGFDFDRAEGTARFAVRLPGASVEAVSIWGVPKQRAFPKGELCFNYSAAPLEKRSEYAAVLARWIHDLRTKNRETSGPRFPEPSTGLSAKAHAVREILIEQYPRAIRGPELVRLLAERELDETEANLSSRIVKQLNAAGCEVRNEGKGYFLVPLSRSLKAP